VADALDGYGREKPLEAEVAQWCDILNVKYPCLTKALLGNELTRKDEPFRPPFSLMITVKDGRLRSLLTSQESSRTWFGPSVDAQDVLASVEAALKGNLGEWSQKPEKNGGHKHRF